MKANKLVEISLRIYAWLLILYPKEHRLEYGQKMIQLFSDQCQQVAHQGGLREWLALWGRTIVDIGKTAASEHFSSPRAKLGLLQAMPGAPLPWKGVALVLIPGLVIFISQIGQLAGKDWYYRTLAWAGYAFIVPVLFVWWRTRKFPVWGLVPLGLLLQQISGLLPDLLMRLYGWLAVSPLGTLFQPLADSAVVGNRSLLVPLVSILLLAAAGWLLWRGSRLPGTTKRWFGIYALVVVVVLAVEVMITMWGDLQYMPAKLRFDGKIIAIVFNNLRTYILEQCSRDAYLAIFFLLLILVSALLARRHGVLAFLLPLGYLLPTIVYGTTIWGTSDPYFPLVGGMVFIYRVSIAIIAPLWIARSISQKQQAWAVAAPIIIALAAQIVLPIAIYSEFTPLDYILQPIMDGLMILAGSALALALYRSVPPVLPEENPPLTLAQELPA